VSERFIIIYTIHINNAILCWLIRLHLNVRGVCVYILYADPDLTISPEATLRELKQLIEVRVSEMAGLNPTKEASDYTSVYTVYSVYRCCVF
jgi:hypothetical protein